MPINGKDLSGTISNSVVFDEDDLILEQVIGKGSFGNVYKAIWSGTDVAVKMLHIRQNNEERQDFIREVSLLSALRHPNIVQFLGTHVKDEEEFYMIFEYMSQGSLYGIIHNGNIELQWDRIKSISIDAVRGMCYLHTCNPIVIHRDLKSHNLLVDDNWKVKVCDFGLSRLASQQSVAMTACGTPAWSSPELLKGEKYDEKIDVYSFGIICWELVMREIPYKGLDTFQIIYQVGTKNIRPELPQDLKMLRKKRKIPKEFVDLFTTCWDTNPSVRPSFREIGEKLRQMN